jgi:hypothetical protein
MNLTTTGRMCAFRLYWYGHLKHFKNVFMFILQCSILTQFPDALL